VLSLVKNVLQPNIEETSDDATASVTAAVNTTNKTDDVANSDNITSSSSSLSDGSDVKITTETVDENAMSCQENTRR